MNLKTKKCVHTARIICSSQRDKAENASKDFIKSILDHLVWYLVVGWFDLVWLNVDLVLDQMKLKTCLNRYDMPMNCTLPEYMR